MVPLALVELALGVKAEGRSLEDLATPLSAEHAGVPSQRGGETATPATGATTG
ncbi:hypothetical protein ACFWRG_03620 [Micromonospora tulbaghiae]|uniref:hypothetical protein n=1 Tax=Micromonospora tulbaghiae TaxID=479978 RepID=UPI003651C327